MSGVQLTNKSIDARNVNKKPTKKTKKYPAGKEAIVKREWGLKIIKTVPLGG